MAARGRLRFVLTGAPGSGKTALLRALEVAGYAVVEEAATDVIALANALGDGEPWMRSDFVDRVLELQLQRAGRADAGVRAVLVFDRSPVCTLALCRWLGYPVPRALDRELDRIAQERTYERRVFFLRSLGSVTPTAARRITAQQAQAFERVHEDAYREQGFELLDVPAGPLSARLAVVREHLPPPIGAPPATGRATGR